MKMYNRMLCGVFLLVVSVAVLRGYTPRGTGITDPACYFRGSGEYRMVGDPWCDLPYIYQERYFTEQKDRLIASGALPGVTGLRDFDCYVQYDENNYISVIRVQWSGARQEDGTIPYISLGIWPQEPTPEDLEGIFRIMQAWPESATETEVLGMTVYGLGEEDWQLKQLGVVLSDGSFCSIVGGNWVSVEQMLEVLDHLLQYGVRYSAFDIEKGDIYETVFGFLHEKFNPYIPDYEAIGMERKDLEDYYLAVNGEPRTTALSFGKQGYNIGWSIQFQPEDDLRNSDLGQLAALSKEILEENLQEEQPYYFGFWVEDAYIYVTLSRRNLVDRVWMLMESLEVSQ